MTPDVRVSERVEWRNVYANRAVLPINGYATRAEADRYAEVWSSPVAPMKRIAVERITITERVERFPVPEEGGR